MNRGENVVKSEGGFRGNGAKNHSATERSEVRILLCDSNAESCRQIFSLHCQCSYQGITAFGILFVFSLVLLVRFINFTYCYDHVPHYTIAKETNPRSLVRL